jgi:pyruvate formate lyase activating enzyme
MTEIKGFLETSFLDWSGKLCSVLFLPRCNFRCPYCHNHPLVFHPERYSSIPLEDVLADSNPFAAGSTGFALQVGNPLWKEAFLI